MFKGYMCDSVVLVRKTGNASWGEKNTTRTTVKARVDGKTQMVRNMAGELVTVAYDVILDNTTLTPADRIEIDGVSRSIISIKKLRSFNRVYGLEVYCA